MNDDSNILHTTLHLPNCTLEELITVAIKKINSMLVQPLIP